MHPLRPLVAATLTVLPLTCPALSPEEEEAYRKELLAVLSEETELATKTRLNADYVPGILTVLHGNDLETRGVRNVREALNSIPGVEVAIDQVGRSKVVVRGFGDIFKSGNVRILIDGVATNNASYGTSNPALALPIEQVERLEVIRGPGSAVHGEYALAGVINIVTYKEKNRAYLRLGEHGERGGGVNAAWTTGGDAPWSFSLNLSTLTSDPTNTLVSRDIIWDRPFSNSPGPANDATDTTAGIVTAKRGGFAAELQWIEHAWGDHYGVNGYLTPSDGEVYREGFGSLQLTQTVPLTKALDLDLFFTWAQFEERSEGIYVGPYQQYTRTEPYDVWLDQRRLEEQRILGGSFTWRPHPDHRLLLELQGKQVRIPDLWMVWNAYRDANKTWHTSEDMTMYPLSKNERDVGSVTLQYEWRASDLMSITGGARYDDYSDSDNALAPRIAAVWRLDDHNIVKAQYARAFRPPTLFDNKVEPELADTLELGYIQKNESTQFAATGFYSEIQDPLVYDAKANKKVNAEKAVLQGLELEIGHRFLSTGMAVSMNGSLIDTRETSSGDAVALAPDWLMNFDLSLPLRPNLSGLLHVRAVGERHRESGDPRGATLEGYTRTDIALNWRDVWTKGMSLRAGVTNVLDADIRQPALMTSISDYVEKTTLVAPSFPDDLPQPGRAGWLQLTYDF